MQSKLVVLFVCLGQLCARCVTVIGEIYSDVQGISSAFRELPGENRENLLKLIDNLEEAANFMFPTEEVLCQGFEMHAFKEESSWTLEDYSVQTWDYFALRQGNKEIEESCRLICALAFLSVRKMRHAVENI